MRRSFLFMLLAGAAALIAAMVVYSALKKREQEVQRAKAQSVDIVVAAHDLHVGAQLDPTEVKLVRWSLDSMPPGAFTDVAAVNGKYVKTPFVENEPIVGDRLFSGVKTAGMMPLLIPSGMHAMSVPVDEVSDISGFVLPGAHVDILVSISDQSTGSQPFSKIVLQNVEVLAVAQEIEEAKDEPKVVKVITVLVTPEEAERLSLASHDGTLRLALRNYDDKKIVMTGGSDVGNMLRGGAPAPLIEHQAVALPPAVIVHSRPEVKVEVMRDGHTSESISFVHGRGARNTQGLKQEMVGSADANFEMAGVENLTPAAVAPPAASTPPAGSTAAAARGPHASHPPSPSALSFSAAPAENPSFAGPNSKTIDVP